jgi:hypothetical protein
MASILPFPARVSRGAPVPAPAAGPARVRPFPLAHDRAVVEAVAREMRAKRSEEEAETVLAGHLEVEGYRLNRMGVVDLDEIERAMVAFARAAWATYDRSEDGVGAA